jgi:hypothetical protein
MVVVHEYVPSSDKSGFYLRDGFDGKIITYQVSAPAEELLYHLDYDDGETLQQEVFDILHRLRLVYTHNSGVEPPDSLMNMDLDQNQIQALDTEDRKTIISHLLDQADLSQKQRLELRSYAKNRDVTLSEGEDDAEREDETDGQSKSDSTSTDSANSNTDNHSNGDRKVSNGDSEPKKFPVVECEYCDRSVKSTDYISHVRLHSDPHSESGRVPEDFSPGGADTVTTGDVDILYQEDLTEDYSYYPVCRWCGTRFLRLPAYHIHLDSNREGFNETLHSRDPDRYQRPMLLPFEDNHVLAIESRIESVVTQEAAAELDSTPELQPQTPPPGKHCASDTVSEGSSNGSSERLDESNTVKFDDRIEVYEENWLLTDLARLLDLLTRRLDENKRTHEHEALSRHHSAILDRENQLSSSLASKDGTLREYREAWDEPEIGVQVPENLLTEYGLSDYRGEIYVPPGYPIPISDIYERLTREWFNEQQNTDIGEDELPVFGTGSVEPVDDSTDSDTNGTDQDSTTDGQESTSPPGPNEKSGEDTTSDRDQGTAESASCEEPQIPLSTVLEVLQEFETYEADRRESSWFHASMILCDAVDSTLESPLTEFRDLEDESE